MKVLQQIDNAKFPDYWVRLLETIEKEYVVTELKKGEQFTRIENNWKETQRPPRNITKITMYQDLKKWSIWMNGLEQTRLKTPDNV